MSLTITNDRDRFYVQFGKGEDAPQFFVEPYKSDRTKWQPEGSLVCSLRGLPRMFWAVIEKMETERWSGDLKSASMPIEFVQQFLALAFEEEARRQIRLSGFQVKAAFTLAAAHYHRWAQVREIGFYLQHATVGQLEDNPEPYGPLDMRGIDWPTVEPLLQGGGVVVHETGTGRTCWMVYQQGLTIEISRPSGTALAVSVDSPLKGGAAALAVDPDQEGVEFGERHVMALAQCLRALVEAELLPVETHERLLGEARASSLYQIEEAVAE